MIPAASFMLLLAPLACGRPAGNEAEINAQHGVAALLYQGDIAVDGRRMRRSVAAMRAEKGRWKMPVPYAFDERFPKRSKLRVLEAMRFWSEKTCITFEENRNAHPHVNIFEGPGCWSFVGRQPTLRQQSLSLEQSCTDHLFVVAHELAHTLGFYHEHSRSDRDNYIDIDYSNVNPNLTFAFAKELANQVPNENYPYEYGSVMHYSVDQFANDNHRPVIYAKRRQYAQSMGNRMRATFHDISRMNVLYNCHERCAMTVNRCAHGGYPAPSDCSQCICPDGFGGQYCETFEAPSIGQRDNPSCGGELYATNHPQTFYGAVRTRVHSNAVLAAPEHCFWHIKADESKKIEIRVKNIISPCSMACSFNALEIKTTNFTMTGYRFCCDHHIYNSHGHPKPIFSDGNLAVIGAFARYDYLSFNIEFRAV